MDINYVYIVRSYKKKKTERKKLSKKDREKQRKYFCYKRTKLLTKRKKYATMLFGQERTDEKTMKSARTIVTK